MIGQTSCIEGLMSTSRASDWTAAIINGRRGIEEAYRTGRKIYIRARAKEAGRQTGRETILLRHDPDQVEQSPNRLKKSPSWQKKKRVEARTARCGRVRQKTVCAS